MDLRYGAIEDGELEFKRAQAKVVPKRNLRERRPALAKARRPLASALPFPHDRYYQRLTD